MNRRLVPALALLLGVLVSLPAAQAADAVVIIVNKSNKIDNLTSKMVRQIFSGQTTKWPDGLPVQTMASSPDTPEHTIAISFLFGMTEVQYKKYLQDTGGAAEPHNAGSPQAVVNLVGLLPGAVSFARQSLVTPSVKVLKIDGLSPGSPGYPLVAQ
jgi:ABC-type phosphate transport system substrate-binding protein